MDLAHLIGLIFLGLYYIKMKSTLILNRLRSQDKMKHHNTVIRSHPLMNVEPKLYIALDKTEAKQKVSNVLLLS